MGEATILFMMHCMGEKLIELMGKKEYLKFSAEVGKKAFKKEVEEMKDSDFKNFVLENFDRITGEADAEIGELNEEGDD